MLEVGDIEADKVVVATDKTDKVVVEADLVSHHTVGITVHMTLPPTFPLFWVRR